MSVELKVPEVGESISEVEISKWLKSEGDTIGKDEPVVEVDSDKVTLEIPSPVAGTIKQILKQPGETAKIGEVICRIEAGETAEANVSAPTATPSVREIPEPIKDVEPVRVTPETREAMKEKERSLATAPTTEPITDKTRPAAPVAKTEPAGYREGEAGREVEIVRMSAIRRRIAERLVSAQANAALLTTFNEIDMSTVIDLRERHRESFQEKYGIKLGFMSFFVKAAIDALKQYPAINAEIRGENIIYRNYYDIGIAIGSSHGLVVPVLRNAERMSFADIEQAIANYAQRAEAKSLALEDLQGGTFTITNGGVYGSLLSTPIINPPQSGVLGMHAIQERPMVREGEIVIRSMMYVALTYDHRIVDGREAVMFLRRIKECIETPARMLLEI